MRHAGCGDIDSVRELLEGGIDVDAVTERTGSTALHRACREGHTAVAQLLLESGADVEAQTAGVHLLCVDTSLYS